MGLPTVKKFLCCITLETGGLIVGWFNIILALIALIFMFSAFGLTIAAFNNGDFNNNQDVIGGFAALMTVYVIMILYYFIVLYASWMLIQGTKHRDHTKFTLFMILMAVGVILQFIQVLTAGWATFISALFFACLSAYFFICIYSLYDLIKNERFGRPYA